MPDDRPRVIPSMIGMLHDVDVSTVPPNDGDTLIWVDADKKWEPLVRAGTDSQGAHDEFTVAGTPATTYSLTYIPVLGTCQMSLNGLVLIEGTDYTCNYGTGDVTVSITQTSGDHITFRYLISSANGAGILVPWNATGWKYLQVGRTDATDYSAAAFNDSAWLAGQAPFGTDLQGGHDFDAFGGYQTHWDIDTRIWLRRHLGKIAAGRTVTVSVRVDNSVSLWWNGTLVINEVTDPAGGLSTPLTATVPGAALGTTNVIAVRATDDPPQTIDKCVIDLQVVAS